MSFDDKFIEQLKLKNDIVEVISAYCNLEQKGGSYWACCPLPGHMEKTPSFCVNQVGQFYHCFGCGRGGDVIKFIQEVESLEFMQAVQLLADRVGLEVPNFNYADAQKSNENKDKKERQLKLLKETAHFYVNNLQDERATNHIEYLKKRGIDAKTVRAFGMGASLDYDSLPRFLKAQGYTYEEMMEAGVVSYNEENKNYSDFLGKRLIIPIIDTFKNVIAFGGRLLEKKDFAKYKNTRETALFVKNKCLYNINNLKQAKRVDGKLDSVIMVEGYMDVISLYSAGFTNVVASMGTSLTQMQAKILKRYTDNVIISYDGDSAGQNATIRGLEILRDAGLTVKVLTLPDGLDPDDVIKKLGKEAYQTLINKSSLLIDYKLEVLKGRFDITTAQGKRQFVDSALKVIREVEKSFEQEELLKQLSRLSGIAYEYLRRDFDNIPQKSGKPSEISAPIEKIETQVTVAERYILCAFLFDKKYADIEKVTDIEFSSKVRRAVFDYILDKIDSGEKIVPSMVFDVIGEDGTVELNEILNAGDGIFGQVFEEKYYFDCLALLLVEKYNKEIDLLTAELNNANALDDRRFIIQAIQSKNNKIYEIQNRRKK